MRRSKDRRACSRKLLCNGFLGPSDYYLCFYFGGRTRTRACSSREVAPYELLTSSLNLCVVYCSQAFLGHKCHFQYQFISSSGALVCLVGQLHRDHRQQPLLPYRSEARHTLINAPFLRDEFGSGEPRIAKFFRVLKRISEEIDKHFDRMTSHFDRQDKRFKDMESNQRLERLLHQAQQPRLAAETDVNLADTKTPERIEGTAIDGEEYGYISSARVYNDLMCLTSFGNKEFTESPVAPEKGIGDVLIDEGAEAPKPHPPPVEVSM